MASNQTLSRIYATLEDGQFFSVRIWQSGTQYILKYRDERPGTIPAVIFTKKWETQGAADEYIALYKQMKGAKANDNSHRQGQPI